MHHVGEIHDVKARRRTPLHHPGLGLAGVVMTMAPTGCTTHEQTREQQTDRPKTHAAEDNRDDPEARRVCYRRVA